MSFITKLLPKRDSFSKKCASFSTAKHHNPAADRNQQPILEVLQKLISSTGSDERLLEISSGNGQHASYVARHFPHISFQPTEVNPQHFASIRAFAAECPSQNVCPPLLIDITQPFQQWQGHPFNGRTPFVELASQIDYMLNINMLHITPFECAVSLFKNAAGLLKLNGLLFTYGPYAVNGVLTPDSNVNFDAYLRSQDPKWGVRDFNELTPVAEANGITLEKSFDLPSNNKLVVWRKTVASRNN